jgi:hypothetical protein
MPDCAVLRPFPQPTLQLAVARRSHEFFRRSREFSQCKRLAKAPPSWNQIRFFFCYYGRQKLAPELPQVRPSGEQVESRQVPFHREGAPSANSILRVATHVRVRVAELTRDRNQLSTKLHC